jgi:hypothetical protein
MDLKAISSTLEIGFAIFIGSFIYILSRNQIKKDAPPYAINRRQIPGAVIGIIAILSLNQTYTRYLGFRPPLYFILISFVVALISIQIVFLKNQSTSIILFELMLVSLCLRSSIFYSVPGLLGSDTWLHQAIMEVWIDNSHITPNVFTVGQGYTSYAEFPVMHLLVISLKLIGTNSFRDCLFLSVGGANIISILFIYLLGRNLTDEKIGIFTSLLICINPTNIAGGTILIPNSLGVSIFTIILYLIFLNRSSFRNIVFYILIISLSYMHVLSNFVILIAITGIFTTYSLYGKLFRGSQKHQNISLQALVFFGILSISKWSYSLYIPSISYFDTMIQVFVNALKNDIEFVGSIVQSQSNSTLNRLWFILNLSFLVYGSLVWIERKNRTQQKHAIIISTGLLAGSYILPVFNITNFRPGRWTPFIFIGGTLLIAQGIYSFSGSFRGKFKSTFLLVAIVFIISMFSINSSLVNNNSPFFNETIWTGFNEKELSAAETASKLYEGEIASDWDYIHLILRAQNEITNVTYIDPLIEERGIIMVRKQIINHPEGIHYNLWRSSETPIEETIDNLSKFEKTKKYNLVYSNREVNSYQKR